MIFLVNLYNLFQDTGLPDVSPDQNLWKVVSFISIGIGIRSGDYAADNWLNIYNGVSFCHSYFWTGLPEYLSFD